MLTASYIWLVAHHYVLVTFKTSSGFFADGYNPKVRIYGNKGDSGKIQLAL